jgi:hypothetical protein
LEFEELVSAIEAIAPRKPGSASPTGAGPTPAEQLAQPQSEAKRKADEENRRVAGKEADRGAKEEQRRLAQAEAKRKAEEKKRRVAEDEAEARRKAQEVLNVSKVADESPESPLRQQQIAGVPASKGERPLSKAASYAPAGHAAAAESDQGRQASTGLSSPMTLEATDTVLRPLCIAALVVAAVMVIGIYVVFASSFSETHMMNLSYFWFPLVAFGISGLSLTKGSLGGSLAVGALSLVLLGIFFVAIFPSL